MRARLQACSVVKRAARATRFSRLHSRAGPPSLHTHVPWRARPWVRAVVFGVSGFYGLFTCRCRATCLWHGHAACRVCVLSSLRFTLKTQGSPRDKERDVGVNNKHTHDTDYRVRVRDRPIGSAPERGRRRDRLYDSTRHVEALQFCHARDPFALEVEALAPLA